MKYTVVTGACGFLGANVVKKLNAQGNDKIIMVDNYDEQKLKNISSLRFSDYISYKQDMRSLKMAILNYDLSAIIHIGANADVLERNADVMMHANYEHSKLYLQLSQELNVPLIYASSSAVYGNAKTSKEDPHNIYAWSKWLFDKHVNATIGSLVNKVIGLRLFNIFGMGEFHKNENASLPYRFFTFVRDNGFIDIFDKHIERDYVWVEDVADVFINLIKDSEVPNGIYDLGGNNPISHKEVADIVAQSFCTSGLKNTNDMLIKVVPFPLSLADHFQFYTKANNLLPMISKQTSGNKEKLTNYINQLIGMTYGNNPL